MSKLGYLLALIAIIVLGTYALWPTPTVATVKLFTTPAPTSWTVRTAPATANGPVQSVHVTPSVVTVTLSQQSGQQHYEFPADPEKAGRLWGALMPVEVPVGKVIEGIGEGQLAAYGVDGSNEAAADDGSLVVRWGGSDGQAYLWNGRERRLLAVPSQVLAGLTAAAAPPIAANVMSMPMMPRRLVVDNLALVVDEGGWQAELYRNRPPFNARVMGLIGQLARIEISDFTGVQVFGLPVVGTVQTPALDAIPTLPGQPAVPGMPAPGPRAARSVTVYDAGGSAVVAVSGFPPQKQDPGRLNEWRTAFAAFKRDVLVDVGTQINRDDVLRIDLAKDGQPWWSLQRRPKPPQTGGYFWDVVWSGGRENAPDDVVERIGALARDAVVREPMPDTAALDHLPAGGVLVTIASDRVNAGPLRFAVAGGELRSATHRARLADDGALLRALDPARFLDDRLTRRDASRVAKIQRRFHDVVPPQDEVVARSEGGTWARSHPKPATGGPVPVDGAAVDRLVRVLAAAHMGDLRLLTGAKQDEAARALAAAPDFELDLRFAAMAGGQASNDETDLDMSAAQDWGIALRREADGWRCVDKDLGVSFTLDNDTVEEFRRPFDAGQVFPVVASAVTQVTITRAGGEVVHLSRNGAAWTVSQNADAPLPADAVAVRRWFRDVGALQLPAGTVLDNRAPEPSPGEITASIACAVPSVSGDPFQPTELLTFAVLAATPKGVPVQVWSNRGGSRFPRGRAVLPGPAVVDLLPAAAAFK